MPVIWQVMAFRKELDLPYFYRPCGPGKMPCRRERRASPEASADCQGSPYVVQESSKGASLEFLQSRSWESQSFSSAVTVHRAAL